MVRVWMRSRHWIKASRVGPVLTHMSSITYPANNDGVWRHMATSMGQMDLSLSGLNIVDFFAINIGRSGDQRSCSEELREVWPLTSRTIRSATSTCSMSPSASAHRSGRELMLRAMPVTFGVGGDCVARGGRVWHRTKARRVERSGDPVLAFRLGPTLSPPPVDSNSDHKNSTKTPGTNTQGQPMIPASPVCTQFDTNPIGTNTDRGVPMVTP